MLEQARRRRLANLVVADGMKMPFANETFDALTIGFGLRNMADYGAAVREMARVIRIGGRVVILDFSLPRSRLRRPYQFYLHRVIPRLAGWLAGNREAYRYLGSSIESFPSGETMCRLLDDNGFTSAEAVPLSGGIASIYVGRRAPA
jgi:demethylmenaquinone methyltransferase/2-methoxy-6-polyprenyl-1,4-benzoquinol methylase